MQDKKNDVFNSSSVKIDEYSLLLDMLKNIWVVGLCMMIASMWTYMYASYMNNSGSTYTASTTLVISVRNSESSAYNNLTAAQNMATSLSNIMQSSLLQKRVCEDLNISSFTADISSNVVTNTNLLNLSVTDKTAEQAYRVLKSIMNNYEQITDAVMQGMMVEILIPATVPKYANHTINENFYMKRGMLIGALIGLVLVALCSILKDTVKNGQDMADKIDAKNLGTIYFESKYKTLNSLYRHKKRSLLITHATTSFPFVESYKKIAAKISYMKKENEGLCLVITSVQENEGKSTVSANIALTLAQTGYKVCIVDCDLRKPALDKVLFSKMIRRNTLPEYLTGKINYDDVIHNDKKHGVSVILTNKELESASELISGDSMKGLIRQLKEEYDYIILDTPPLSGAADAESLADCSDASILVVRYDRVRTPVINDAIDILNGSRAKVAGCILNQVHVLGRQFAHVDGYGYGYDKYYSKYYHRSQRTNGSDIAEGEL